RLFPVTLAPAAGDVIVTCIFLAPLGSIPSLIGMDELGIGLDISGIGDLLWPAADGCPDEHAVTASAIAHTPTAPESEGPGRKRPGARNLGMDGPAQVPAPAKWHGRTRL